MGPLFTDIADLLTWLPGWATRGARPSGAASPAVREQLSRFRRREIDTAGDGFFATFDGPARAIRCATAIRYGLRGLGLTVRAGLHTGEVELIGDKVGGIAVHTGARVSAQAGPARPALRATASATLPARSSTTSIRTRARYQPTRPQHQAETGAICDHPRY